MLMPYSKKDRLMQIWIYVFAVLMMFAMMIMSSEEFADFMIEFFN